MSDSDLGQFSEGFASWRQILGAVEPNDQLKIFANAVADVATFVVKGLDRVVAIDELAEMATAYGLNDADAVQAIIAKQFEDVPRGNGHADDFEDEPEAKAPPLLRLIDIRAWHGTEPRPRQWLIDGCIPDRNVTLLTGQGGVGKTLIMQQLSVATVLGKDWFGLLPNFGPVLFITAEDDESEMHIRYHSIAKAYDTTFNELADNGLHLLSLAGKDAAMGIADHRGVVRPTELWHTTVRTAQAIRPRWIALDTAADIFLVNERDRAEVRQCITLLRGLALDINTCVILLAHPSLTGISSGSGLSGSTAWHNSVRSRLYLKSETNKKKKSDDVEDEITDEPAPDLSGTRVLSFMKSNYSALAQDIHIEWKDGLFRKEVGIRGLSAVDKASLDRKAQDAFCAVLKRINTQNMPVSPKERANNYVVTLMMEAPEVKALHEKKSVRYQLLAKALKNLLAAGDLFCKPGPEGFPASKQRECLYLGKRMF